MATQKFDQLNNLQSQNKVISIEEYFHEMPISEADANKRIALAYDIKDEFEKFFQEIAILMTLDKALEREYLLPLAIRRYTEALERNGLDLSGSEAYTSNIVYDNSEFIVDTTLKNPDKEYNLSDDRATFIGEQESNAISEKVKYEKAKAQGKNAKRWKCRIDGRERHSHQSANGQSVQIEEPFSIGDSLMMYPTDYESFGANPREIVRCRCTCDYFYSNKFKDIETEFTNNKQSDNIKEQKYNYKIPYNIQMFANGAQRSQMYSSGWASHSLKSVLKRFDAGKPYPNSKRTKLLFDSNTDKNIIIVYDPLGDYFTIQNINATTKRMYLDIYGNEFPNNIVVNGVEHGMSKQMYRQKSHYKNSDGGYDGWENIIYQYQEI